MTVILDAARLERRRKKALKARDTTDRYPYFHNVALARYVLRKVFRLVEEEAKREGIDPLAHQALIQIYGSPNSALRVKDVAERLDISPAFSSSLAKLLVEKGYVARQHDPADQRAILVAITDSGRQLLHRIDEQVQIHVDYFSRTLKPADREAAIFILMFYVGVSLRPATQDHE